MPIRISALKSRIKAFDDAVDRRFDEIRGHKIADRVMYTASELGDFGLVWHIVGTAQALRPGRKEMSAVRVITLLGVESVLVNGVIKSFFRRKRPVVEVIRPHYLRAPRSTSFPSGHASSAFTAAGLLAEDDGLWPMYYALAAVVATSRVYVKIHHASDVIAGAALGMVLARTARRMWPPPS